MSMPKSISAEEKKPISTKPTSPPKIIKVQRYNIPQRLHHWIHVITMILFFFTGLELVLQMYFIGDYVFTRSIHYIFGIFIGLWDLLFFISVVIIGKEVHALIPTPRDILDLVIILLCALRILPDEKYPHYDYYIVEKEEYIMKYHPAQKLLSLTNLLAIFAMGVTGIALAEEISKGSTLIFGVLTLLLIPFKIFYLDVRFIHFLIYVYFLGSTMVHFYFALIPANRNRLRGMITGKEHIPIEP
ncbi:MAG: cytochrome b/b6 domain-containing protein [Candidatus Hodarchaeales archaeon]|jgi:cytochrome b subunit of formate dehydrogenase